MTKIRLTISILAASAFLFLACAGKPGASQPSVNTQDSGIISPDSSRLMDSLHKVSAITDTGWSQAAKTMVKEVPVAKKGVLPVNAASPKADTGKVKQMPAFINPFRPPVLLDGLKKAQAGDLKGAIEDFTTAIQKNPKNYNAYFYRAKARIESGDQAGAMDDINNAIQNRPVEAIYYYYRGKMYSDKGESGNAMLDFNKALSLNRKFTDAFNYRGVEKAKTGNHAAAIIDYDSAILYNANYPICYYNKGTSQAALGNYRQAIESFSRCISLDSKYALSYLNRGNCYVQIEDYKSAIADYTSLLQLQPKNADAYYNRGAAHFLLGDNQMCNDWKMARSLGNANAKAMLDKHCK